MVANEETFDENTSLESNYKEQYKEMKRKLRLLIYVSDEVGHRNQCRSGSLLGPRPNAFQLAFDLNSRTQFKNCL